MELLKVIVPIIVALIPVLATVLENGKKTVKAVDEVSKKLDAHIKDDDFRAAKAARIRILRFYDEVCAGDKHSENHFEDIIDDIDFYEQFTKAHQDFHNNRGEIAMKRIKEVYEKCKNEGSFLR